MAKTYPFTLQELSYPYDTLSPIVGEETLHFHHDKHMNAYVDNLNKAIEPYAELHDVTLNGLLAHLNQLPQTIQTAVRNNGGGVYNHQLYFSTVGAPNAGTKPDAALQSAIERDFGSMDEMKAQLGQTALTRFGSGWAYLVADAQGKLSICSTPNQDVPDLSQYVPLMTVDVWEHAYYLDYQNRRPDYVKAFLTLTNWDVVSKRYADRASLLETN